MADTLQAEFDATSLALRYDLTHDGDKAVCPTPAEVLIHVAADAGSKIVDDATRAEDADAIASFMAGLDVKDAAKFAELPLVKSALTRAP